jgi:hypothetical protein
MDNAQLRYVFDRQKKANSETEIDPKDNKSYIYDDKREEIEFFKNKFAL